MAAEAGLLDGDGRLIYSRRRSFGFPVPYLHHANQCLLECSHNGRLRLPSRGVFGMYLLVVVVGEGRLEWVVSQDIDPWRRCGSHWTVALPVETAVRVRASSNLPLGMTPCLSRNKGAAYLPILAPIRTSLLLLLLLRRSRTTPPPNDDTILQIWHESCCLPMPI